MSFVEFLLCKNDKCALFFTKVRLRSVLHPNKLAPPARRAPLSMKAADPSLATSLEDKVAHALEARAALAEARLAARRDGRPADWYVARRAAQRWAGLSNEGATCYLNSLLQALFVSPEVRRAVFSFCYDEQLHGAPAACVPLQLCKLFTRMQHTQQVALSTRKLTASFGWSQADSFRQHDVQELCRVLFQALERSGPASVPGSAAAVVELFEGRLRSTVRCCRCGHESVRSEAFRDVQLGIANVSTVEEALESFVRWETLDGGDDAWCCEACERRVGALKGVCFESLPPLLMLQLKRFTYDTVEMRHRKLHHRVHLPLTLRMRRYRSPQPEQPEQAATCATSASSAVTKGPTEGQPGKPDGDGDGATADAGGEVDDDDGGGDTYDCVGVLLHAGSTSGGHYTALLREAPLDARPEVPGCSEASRGCSEEWFEFDDASVQPAPPHALRDAAGGGAPGDDKGGGESQRGSCYMLIYRRRRGADARAPEPPAAVLAEVAAEEAAAESLRAYQRSAAELIELRLLAAHDVRAEASLQLHVDTPAASLLSLAAAALPRYPLEDHTRAAAAAAADTGAGVGGSAAGATADAADAGGSAMAGVQLRLRRWDAKRGVPEAPLDLEAEAPTEAEAEAEAVPEPQGARSDGGGAVPPVSTLGSLGLGRKPTLLLEARPRWDTWPLPSADDLYVRARLWTRPEAARRGAGEPVHAGRGTSGEEWEAECDEGGSFSFGRRSAAAASAAVIVAPAEEGKDVLDRQHDKHVRFAPLAAITLPPSTSAGVDVSATLGNPNSRGRRLSWSTLSFESVDVGSSSDLHRRVLEARRNHPPPPPSSASSVSSISSNHSSRRSSASSEGTPASSTATSCAASEDDDDEPGAELGPEQLLCVPRGAAAGAAPLAVLAALAGGVEAAFGVPPPLQRLVRVRSAARGTASELLAVLPAPAPAPAQLVAGDELLVERAESAAAASVLLARREARRHRLRLTFNSLHSGSGSCDMSRALIADGRETVAALKGRIAGLLRADPAAIRLRRGGPRGAHLRAEAETLVGVGGASLSDGSSVYVERGAPLSATDALVAVYWCEAGAPDEVAGSVGGGGGGGGGERRGSRDVRPPRETTAP